MRLPFIGNFVITQSFGNVLIINGVNIYAQWGLKGHDGIDYGAPTGSIVVAPHDGVILEAAFDPEGYGNYLKVESAIEGSVIAHMLSFKVRVGDVVKEGQELGVSDNTGNSTGSHIHWGYYRIPRNRGNGYNGFIDQTPYLQATPPPPPAPAPQPAPPPVPVPPNDPIGKAIEDYLASQGYNDPNAYLDVVKAMNDSDMKLKSGQYITKTECQQNVEAAATSMHNNDTIAYAKDKADILDQCEVDKKKAVDAAVVQAVQSYQEVINSNAYKLANALVHFFHLS